MNKRGYCGIGMVQFQHECNMGTLLRSAYAFGADFVFTIGRKYKQQASDTCNATSHIPYFKYQDYDDFKKHLPDGCRIVCVELTDKSYDLKTFVHPEKAVYLLGNETTGIPEKYLKDKNSVSVQIKYPASIPLNVAMSGSIVLYDRSIKENMWSKNS